MSWKKKPRGTQPSITLMGPKCRSSRLWVQSVARAAAPNVTSLAPGCGFIALDVFGTHFVVLGTTSGFQFRPFATPWAPKAPSLASLWSPFGSLGTPWLGTPWRHWVYLGLPRGTFCRPWHDFGLPVETLCGALGSQGDPLGITLVPSWLSWNSVEPLGTPWAPKGTLG